MGSGAIVDLYIFDVYHVVGMTQDLEIGKSDYKGSGEMGKKNGRWETLVKK